MALDRIKIFGRLGTTCAFNKISLSKKLSAKKLNCQPKFIILLLNIAKLIPLFVSNLIWFYHFLL